MNISKNVIRDLLPVYVAGEASAETRALVDIALAEDEELRTEVKDLATVPSMPEPAAPPDLGIAALKRTQRLLRRRTFLVGFCYFFTTLTFAFVIRPASSQLCIPVYKVAATASLCLAIGGWIEFLRNALRLRDTGLQPRYSLWPQLGWFMSSYCILTACGLVLYDWTHWYFLDRHSGMLIGLAMPLAYIGQWLKLYKPGNEVVLPVETLVTLAKRHDLEEEE
ncbi:membrane hypothetical protein [Candidatus Sulfopaludibacter sp. SbA3]|nr:membrane hypothetical protein [Candidatus Sulfopaludibacter sp. SbA3]